jgi:hypothetical protein
VWACIQPWIPQKLWHCYRRTATGSSTVPKPSDIDVDDTAWVGAEAHLQAGNDTAKASVITPIV